VKLADDPFNHNRNKGHQSFSGYSGSINPFYEDNHQVSLAPVTGGAANKKEKTRIVQDPFFNQGNNGYRSNQHDSTVRTSYANHQRQPTRPSAASSYKQSDIEADDAFFGDYHPLGYFSSSKPSIYPPQQQVLRKQVPLRVSNTNGMASDPLFRNSRQNNAAVIRGRPQQSVDKLVVVLQ
jgi:hypothetical protein